MKKTLLNIIWALALVAIIPGCEKSSGGDGDDNAPKEFFWHFNLSNADPAQTIGVFLKDFNGGFNNGEFRLDASTGASFEIKTDYPLSEGGKIYAYAPYSAGSNDHKAVRMSIPEEQTAGVPAMPRVAAPVTLASAPDPETPISLQLLDLAATLSLKVYSTQETGEKIASVSFASDVPVAGSFNFNIKGVDANQPATLALSGYSGKSVSVSAGNFTVGTDPGTARAIPVVIAPGSYTGTVTVVTDKDTYSVVIDEAVTLVRGGTTELSVRIAPKFSQDGNGSTEDFTGGDLETE